MKEKCDKCDKTTDYLHETEMPNGNVKDLCDHCHAKHMRGREDFGGKYIMIAPWILIAALLCSFGFSSNLQVPAMFLILLMFCGGLLFIFHEYPQPCEVCGDPSTYVITPSDSLAGIAVCNRCGDRLWKKYEKVGFITSEDVNWNDEDWDNE